MGSSDACPNDDAVESELIVVDGQRVGAVHDRMHGPRDRERT